MRRLSCMPAIAGASLLLAGPAAALWAPTDGPEGVAVVSISIDDATGRVYLAEGPGLHRSDDGGLTWQTIGAGAGLTNIHDVYAHPGGPLLAGVSYRGVFWSTDGGQTWDNDQITINPHTGLGATISAVGVSPNGTWLASSYRSTNGGASWSEMSIYGNDFVTSQGTTLAATSTGVFASTTNGVSWSPSTTGMGSSYVQALAAATGGRIYAAVFGGGVFRSTDNGATWSPASSGLGSLDVRALDTDASGRVYAATAGAGVYVSIDDATSWTPTPGGVPDPLATAVATTPTAGVYVGAASAGIALSTDLGATWELRNAGLTAHSLSAITFTSSGTGLVGSIGGGIFRSADGGDSWTNALTGLGSRLVTALIETPGGDLLAATWNDVYRSSDDGLTWSPSGLAGERVLDLGEASDGTMYAVAQIQTGTSTHVFRSADDGVSWTSVLEPADVAVPTSFTSVVVDDANRVFAGGDSFFVDGTVLVSDDAGETWTESSLGAIAVFLADMAVDGDAVYVLTDRSGVYLTEDHGSTWTQLAAAWTSNGQTMTIAPGGEVWVGTSSEGVFRSADGGATWTPFNDGFAGTPNLSALAVHGPDVYAGTASRGLFRSPMAAPVAVPNVATDIIRLPAPRPNPFTTGVTVTFDVAATGFTHVDVFDVRGRQVRRLVDGDRAPGRHDVTWNGRDAAGRRVPAGTYLVRIESTGGVTSRSVTFVR